MRRRLQAAVIWFVVGFLGGFSLSLQATAPNGGLVNLPPGLSSSSADKVYLRLDTTNDPLTGPLDVQSLLNSAASNACNASSSSVCIQDSVTIDGNIINSLANTPVKITDVDGLQLSAGALYGTEISTPTAIANHWSIYTKTDDLLYYQDGAGVEHLAAGNTTYKSYSGNKLKSAGAWYIGGYYHASATAASLNEVSTFVNWGEAGSEPWGAHAFIVASGAGAYIGGEQPVDVKVTGTSMTDAGVLTASDSEIIWVDITTAQANRYAETTKKWVGTVQFSLRLTGQTSASFDFNYGFAKYEDMGNRNFTVTDFECTGLSDANATIDIELIHHNSSTWTYDATNFVPGDTAIVQMSTDYSTYVGVRTGQNFAYKRSGLSTAINGAGSEGTMIRVTHGVGGDLDVLNCHLGVTF